MSCRMPISDCCHCELVKEPGHRGAHVSTCLGVAQLPVQAVCTAGLEVATQYAIALD